MRLLWDFNNGGLVPGSSLRLSGPGALLFFRTLIALIISSLEGIFVSISRSTTATWMSGSVSGGGRFNISLKYSAHHASCSSVINSFPSLSLIGTSKFFLNRSQTCFVIIVQRGLVSFVCCFFCLSRHIFEVFVFVASG